MYQSDVPFWLISCATAILRGGRGERMLFIVITEIKNHARAAVFLGVHIYISACAHTYVYMHI